MKVARVDSESITDQASKNIATLQDFWQDGYVSQEYQNDLGAIKQIEQIFAWYNQLKEEDKTLPEDAKTPGYNPETQTVLKADDEANCSEYREFYVRLYLMPRVAKKLVEQIKRGQEQGNTEAMKPETIAAIDGVMTEAKKLIDREAAQKVQE